MQLKVPVKLPNSITLSWSHTGPRLVADCSQLEFGLSSSSLAAS